MTTATQTGSLGELLVEKQVVTAAQLHEALAAQSSLGLPLGETIIRLGMAKPSQVFPVLESQMNVPWADLSEGLVDPAVVRLISREKAERYGVLAMFRVRDTLTVAMSDPRAIFVIDELEQATGLRLLPVLVSKTDVQQAVSRYYAETEIEEAAAQFESEAEAEAAPTVGRKAAAAAIDAHQDEADAGPIVNLVNVLLSRAVDERASDVHIEPGREHVSIRFRIDGELHEIMTPKLTLHPALISRLKVMTRMDIAEHRRPQDGRTMVSVHNREIDIRASCMPTTQGEKMALRLLDRESANFDLHQLGMRDAVHNRLKQVLAKPNGMALVTGPTGSGKTTTLYCLLNALRGVERNVLSVEDPVEYELDYVNQVQVNEAIGLTFASILRTFLRQDPDYIMVGEIRDIDTAKMAVQAALTGHMVLSTLHTNDAVATIARLINLGIDSAMVAAAVQAVVAQRLVRTVCPKCAQPETPTEETLRGWGLDPHADNHLARGKGCPHCYGTGYRGRLGIYELLVIGEAFRAAVADEVGIEQLRRVAKEEGLNDLLSEGRELVRTGRTTMSEVLSVVDLPEPSPKKQQTEPS